MALWLVRTGRYGQFEDRFFSKSRIYLTWTTLQERNLEKLKDFSDVRKVLKETHPEDSEGTIGNWTGQIWAFLVGMQKGDWIVSPRKTKPTIAFGELVGPYQYDQSADVPFRHSREVKWLHLDVQRFIDSHYLAKDKLKLEFRAELVCEDFPSSLLNLLALTGRSWN